MKKVLIMVMVVSFSLLLSACNRNDDPKYIQVVIHEESTTSEEITVPFGAKLDALNNIVGIDGKVFEGWYTSEDLTTKVAFTEITEEVELYAAWSDYDNSNLTSLPYYEYLSSSNPLITIKVQGGGIMKLELFPSVAPNTVDNFINYVVTGSYFGTTFHRVIQDFMIQGGMVDLTYCPIVGDFSSNGIENDLSHTRGVLSMARSSANNSATSQFFIMHKDTVTLDTNYAAFGGLTYGFSTLDVIARTPTNASDAPTTDIVIESITVQLNGYEYGEPVCGN